VRFDLTGLGDSPEFPVQPVPLWYENEWLEDVEDVVHQLQPTTPDNLILVGLCSGAYHAAEAALKFGARAAWLLNPPAGTDLLHAAATYRRSRPDSRMAKLLRELHLRQPWLGVGAWQVLRLFLPRRYSEDLISSVASRGTSLYVVSNMYDLSPYARTPLLRSIDSRRVVRPRNYTVDFVPEMDHAMHNPRARDHVGAQLTTLLRDLL
jgi:pimeloyl-ACP methyl ester carboxylesterase